MTLKKETGIRGAQSQENIGATLRLERITGEAVGPSPTAIATLLNLTLPGVSLINRMETGEAGKMESPRGVWWRPISSVDGAGRPTDFETPISAPEFSPMGHGIE